MSYDWEGKPGAALKMHAWIRDATLALIAAADLSVAFMHAIHLEKSGKEKERWRTSSILTSTRTLLLSPEILMQKLQPCYANARAEIGQKFSARLSLR
jgi:hypothetical protein